MLALFRTGKADKQRVEELYASLVDISRQPTLFEDYKVPDDVDGRFEMICLHAAVYMICLNNLDEHKFAQKFFDRIFIEVDRACREMGIGDLSVPKHMKKMMVAFNGRVQKYKEVLESDDTALIVDALRRNIFGGNPEAVTDKQLASLAKYLQDNYKSLSGYTADEIKDNKAVWQDLTDIAA